MRLDRRRRRTRARTRRMPPAAAACRPCGSAPDPRPRRSRPRPRAGTRAPRPRRRRRTRPRRARSMRVDHGAQGRGIRQQRRDVAEQDARLGVVGNRADQRLGAGEGVSGGTRRHPSRAARRPIIGLRARSNVSACTTLDAMTSPDLAERPTRPHLPPGSRVVAHRRHLPDLPALVRRQLRRRHRRPARRHRAPRRPRRPRRRRALAEPLPALAAEGRRLRRRRTTATSTRSSARSADFDDDARARRTAAASGIIVDLVPEPLVRPARVVPGRRWPPRPGSPRARALPLPRRQGRDGRAAAEQLGVGLRRSGVDARRSRPTARPASGTCTCSTRRSPTSTGRTKRCARSSAASCASGSTAGVDGFRVDVAHGLDQGRRPARLHAADRCRLDGRRRVDDVPYWGQRRRARDLPRLARPRRRVRRRPRAVRRGVAARRPSRPRCGCVPTRCTRRSTSPTSRPSGMPRPCAPSSTSRSRAYAAVGAPSTWVLSNHDVVRHASRLALTAENPQGHGIGPDSPGKPIPEVGLRRARAATTRHARAARLGLPLPGRGARPARGHRPARRGAPGPDLVPHRRRALRPRRLPRAAAVDARPAPPTASARPAPPGCRSPPSGRRSPATRRSATPASTLSLYRTLLAARRAHDLGCGHARVARRATATDVVAFRNGNVTVVANIGATADRRCRTVS